MKQLFDLKAPGAESKTDIGILFFAAGLGGISDAVFDVAAYSQPLAFSAICGPTALGLKKIFEGLREAGKPPPPPSQ